MISKVSQPHNSGLGTKQIHILGASMGGRRNLGITNQILLLFFLAAILFQFFITYNMGTFLVSLLPKDTPGLALTYEPPRHFLRLFHP